ncbi:N-acyl-phosphatidylethanolamine-hydrolyzing phospholipase D-like protein [Sarcoptes scabiei]|uniref:N-acyl-phosphatidylethanolamine-hydrolyzing phospholipase D-like protein n=1 Tax=Sarcoptes scabiei TaxID=52283 RepID=A0A132ABT2_SARSC|nr:N-acyl-phosphatidylethanolamine-hydrolyzing phospholipase D-like protein [Sarcoptes scabiei]
MHKFKLLGKDKRNNVKKNDSQQNDDNNHPSDSGRKLISRNAVICSSGKDKYHHDSERAEIPVRSVNNELEHVSPIHASRQSMYSASDFRSSSSTLLSRQNSQVVKRHTVVNRMKLESPILIDGKFQNPWINHKVPTFTNILKLGLSNEKRHIPSKKELNNLLPILEPNIKSHPPLNGLRITWLGHSTILAEFDNISVLTDPIFSERASPSQVFGPKRYRDSPCTIHDLPSSLDAVIISHSHYDHLDLNSVVLLNARYGNDLRWFIPRGLGDWFSRMECDNIVELDWWETNCLPDKGDVSFVFTPAQHWSKRTLTDDNRSLWGSWVVKGPRFKFFFTGDTGFCEVFKRIGSIYGPFDVAAIPIGTYEPRKQMKHQHINPGEAVQLHKDLKSRFSIGIHWGTFAFSSEHFLDPPNKLRSELERSKISTKKFVTFMHGETRIIYEDGKIEHPFQKKLSN